MKQQPGRYLQILLESVEEGAEQIVFKGVRLKTERRRNGQRNQVEEFESDRQAFIDALLNNIRSRFPNVQLLSAFQVTTFNHIKLRNAQLTFYNLVTGILPILIVCLFHVLF